MKKLIVLFAGLFLMTIAVQSVMAQNPKDATATTTAVIITPITIEKIDDLSFGNIAAGAQEGTVTVATGSTRSKTGDVTLPSAIPGTITAAKFTVSGQANATYSITVPSAFNVTSPGNAAMQVSTFVTNPSTTGTLSETGSQDLFVGATIAVAANQAAGTYTNGDGLKITVDYN